jgi:hypothetical protein
MSLTEISVGDSIGSGTLFVGFSVEGGLFVREERTEVTGIDGQI